MTSSETLDDVTPPAPAQPRRLRRAHDGRVGAGVAAGLGEYFGLDPVLFRVLFATSAFFGGAGVIAYLLAWAAIPDEGIDRAPVDGWIEELRRRRVPLWVVGAGVGVLIWLIAFSWWAPGRFVPVVGAIALVLFLVARRDPRDLKWLPPAPVPPAPPVDLRKHSPVDQSPTPPYPIGQYPVGQYPSSATRPPYPPTPPAAHGSVPPWMAQGRSWFDDARAAARARRRRTQPVRIAALIMLSVTFGALALVDALTGIPMQIYFWSGLAITVAGLLVGLVLRRAPVSLAVLAIPFALGTIAFAGSSASFSDGTGQHRWTPTGSPAAEYRLAFGQGVLDLRSMATPTKPERIDVTMGAGRALIIVAPTLNATVHADVRFGNIEVDGRTSDGNAGTSVSQTVRPPSGAKGQPVTINVHLADGNVAVNHH